MKTPGSIYIVACTIALMACDGKSDAPATPMETAETNQSSTDKPGAAADMWQGEAQGYLADGDPATDVVAYLVNVGTVDAHFSAFRELAQNRDRNQLSGETIAGVINDRMRNAYKSVEERVIAETSASKSLTSEINALSSAEMIAAMNQDPRAKLPNWSLASDRFRYWTQGAIEGVKGRYPKQILLARSALVRKAGDEIAAGRNAKGEVVDPVRAELGHAYLQAASDTGRMSISFCDAQRIPARETREASYDLDGRLYEKKANAGDVYELAATIEKRAESLSDDGNDC